MTTAVLAQAAGAERICVNGLMEQEIPGISTDSRTIRRGEVFLALTGPRFDGHDYVQQANEKGAVASVVERGWFERNRGSYAETPFLVVADTLQAYGRIARAYRKQFDVRVIGVTGTNGKTATKEMIAQALGTRYTVLASEGNYNNQIGLPQTLFRLTKNHEYAVLEMGTNQPGDIQDLCEIAEPEIGVITNIGEGHLEKLHSKEDVAREKSMLIEALPVDGIAVLNSDDPYLQDASGMKKAVWYGYGNNADIRIKRAEAAQFGTMDVEIEIAGDVPEVQRFRIHSIAPHIAYSVASAVALAHISGCDLDAVREALEQYTTPKRRLELKKAGGITLIDDTYNSNPNSLEAAIAILEGMPCGGKKWAVLGDMLELGGSAKERHEQAGDILCRAHIDRVYTYGDLMSYCHERVRGCVAAAHFMSVSALTESVRAEIGKSDCLLVKGSRATNMSSVADMLYETFTAETDG